MTRDEYLQAVKKTCDKINELKDIMSKTTEEYINDHAQYPDHTKVRVVMRSGHQRCHEGFIAGWMVIKDGDVIPRLHKIKRDGTESQTCVASWYFEKNGIERIEIID